MYFGLYFPQLIISFPRPYPHGISYKALSRE